MRTELAAIEASGIYTNFGPVNTRAEQAVTEQVFGGRGSSLLVNNATSGLMIAIREAVPATGERRYALMPSFTFAATAHAAIWCGLRPLLSDIDPETWCSSADAEDALIDRYRGEIACVVPYAPFGSAIDLDRYARLSKDLGIGVVVDAAASIGTLDADGLGFGSGFPHPLVFSLHATKTFATGEAGLIHCTDAERLSRLRAMANFGFARPRRAMLPGMNAKLSEHGALLVLAKLQGFDAIVEHRAALAAAYRQTLRDCHFQREVGMRVAHQFMPCLLPADVAQFRPSIIDELSAAGIGTGTYFSPHLAEQDYFRDACTFDDLSATDATSVRVMALPMADEMTLEDVAYVCAALNAAVVRCREG